MHHVRNTDRDWTITDSAFQDSVPAAFVQLLYGYISYHVEYGIRWNSPTYVRSMYLHIEYVLYLYHILARHDFKHTVIRRERIIVVW